LDRAASAGLIDDAAVLSPHDAWALRHSVTEGLARRGTVVGVDVSVRRSDLPAFVAAAAHLVAEQVPGGLLADFGHWGDGGVHANVVLPSEAHRHEQARVRELLLDLAVRRFGGSFSAEHGVGPITADWWRATTSAGTARLVAAAADAADPLGILGHPDLPFRTSAAGRE
jgi:FAD/FMN-containing dehydrogenase